MLFAQTPWEAPPQLLCAEADSGQQVWFRQEIQLPDSIRKVWLTVQTTGYVEAFVNAFNASTADLLPDRRQRHEQPLSVGMELTHLIQPGKNVISLCFTPENHAKHSFQVAPALWGEMPDGTERRLGTSLAWLCKPAPYVRTAQGGTVIDARQAWEKPWSDNPDMATWLPATILLPDERKKSPTHKVNGKLLVVRKVEVLTPQSSDRTSCIYTLPAGFYGRIRITLRGAKQGMRMYCNNDVYVCKGELDEQFSPHYSPGSMQVLNISGENGWKTEMITHVEALSLGEPYSVPTSFFTRTE